MKSQWLDEGNSENREEEHCPLAASQPVRLEGDKDERSVQQRGSLMPQCTQYEEAATPQYTAVVSSLPSSTFQRPNSPSRRGLSKKTAHSGLHGLGVSAAAGNRNLGRESRGAVAQRGEGGGVNGRWREGWEAARSWAASQPPLKLFLTVSASLCVVIAGALLFLTMTGMMNHALSPADRESVIEMSSQVLTLIFTLAVAWEQPERARNFLTWWRATYHNRRLLVGSGASSSFHSVEEREQEMKRAEVISSHAAIHILLAKFPWCCITDPSANEDSLSFLSSASDRCSIPYFNPPSGWFPRQKQRWFFLGSLLNLQILHCFIQYTVAYLMWGYFDPNLRPKTLTTSLVAMAIVLGMGTGIVEGMMKTKPAHTPRSNNVSSPTLSAAGRLDVL